MIKDLQAYFSDVQILLDLGECLGGTREWVIGAKPGESAKRITANYNTRKL